MPEGLALGLAPELLQSHIAWDPGARELAEHLAAATGAPLLLGSWSRLVVDLNRRATDPGVVPEHAFGVEVPGNSMLSARDRARRLARWHQPWREAALRAAEAQLARHGRLLHLSVHSFEPALDPPARAFELGLLFDPGRPEEQRWASLLGRALTGAGVDVRENAPYLGVDEGHCTALRERWPDPLYAGLELELSQAVAPARAEAIAACIAARLTPGASRRA